MNKYEVVSDCYVPVGKGYRYKRSGQVVTLSDDAAVLLGEQVRLVGGDQEQEPAKPKRKRVAKRNTPPEVVEPEVVEPEIVEPEVVEEVAEEVTSDDGYPRTGHE